MGLNEMDYSRIMTEREKERGRVGGGGGEEK